MEYTYVITSSSAYLPNPLTQFVTKKNIHAAMGLLFAVMGIKLFVQPLAINIGGFAGLYAIANTYLKIPNILSSILLNAAPFLWAYRKKGMRAIIRSLVVTACFSLLLDIFPGTSHVYSSYLVPVAAVAGSLLTGLGFGMILISDASTGGSDFLGLMIHEALPKVSVGTAMTCVNGSIVLLTGLLCGVDKFLWSLVSMAIVNLTIGAVVDRYNKRMAV